jgi:hypothetical protein
MLKNKFYFADLEIGALSIDLVVLANDLVTILMHK